MKIFSYEKKLKVNVEGSLTYHSKQNTSTLSISFIITCCVITAAADEDENESFLTNGFSNFIAPKKQEECVWLLLFTPISDDDD